MSTEQNPLTPPPASSPAQVPAPAQPQAAAPRPGGTSWITVTLAVIGGLALVGTGATAAVAASGDLSRSDTVLELDVTGVSELDLNASASDVRVEFGDVDQAQLAVTGGRGGPWTLQRDEDELLVRGPETVFGWWFGGWFDDDRSVVLTLPSELQGLDASFTLSAGSLDVTGRFGELDTELSAGDLTISGSASSLDADVSAGSADILLDGVREADFAVSAGDLTVELTGAAPSETSIDVSAGGLDLSVPVGEYNITQNVSAGTLDNRLDHSSSSRNSIDVTLSAGTVTLRPGR